jgi:hypothetical protein
MTVKFGEMKDLVTPVISIDQYVPKIGEPSETVVVAYEVSYEQPAHDLSNLIETDIIDSLDVDISQGPNADSKYMVFVEFERNKDLYDSIVGITKIVSNVTGITDWKFSYYKGDGPIELNDENLRSAVLDNPEQYVLQCSTVEPETTEPEVEEPAVESLQRMKHLAGLI